MPSALVNGTQGRWHCRALHGERRTLNTEYQPAAVVLLACCVASRGCCLGGELRALFSDAMNRHYCDLPAADETKARAMRARGGGAIGA